MSEVHDGEKKSENEKNPKTEKELNEKRRLSPAFFLSAEERFSPT